MVHCTNKRGGRKQECKHHGIGLKRHESLGVGQRNKPLKPRIVGDANSGDFHERKHGMYTRGGNKRNKCLNYREGRGSDKRPLKKVGLERGEITP